MRFFTPMRCVQNDMAECFVQNDVAGFLQRVVVEGDRRWGGEMWMGGMLAG